MQSICIARQLPIITYIQCKCSIRHVLLGVSAADFLAHRHDGHCLAAWHCCSAAELLSVISCYGEGMDQNTTAIVSLFCMKGYMPAVVPPGACSMRILGQLQHSSQGTCLQLLHQPQQQYGEQQATALMQEFA